MSIKRTAASALSDFPFDPAVGFLGQKPGEQPCCYCVLSLHQDVRVCCVAEEGSASRCILCADTNQTCCAIPKELLGAAQKIWNSYTTHALAYGWSGLQRWRIANCFDECTSAFRETYDVLLNPDRTLSIDRQGADLVNHVRELALKREALSAYILAVADGRLSPAEKNSEMVDIFPGPFDEIAKVNNLRIQLGLIDSCPDTAVSGEKSDLREFPKKLKAELVTLLSDVVANGAPAPRVADRTP